MTACADDLEDFSWTDESDEVEEFIASSDEEMATDAREALEAMRAAEQAMRDAAEHRAQHPGNMSGNKRREKEGIPIRHERCNMDQRFQEWEDAYFKRFYRVQKQTFLRCFPSPLLPDHLC